MLEPYVMKVTRTVLRRGGESNLSNLSDNKRYNILILAQKASNSNCNTKIMESLTDLYVHNHTTIQISFILLPKRVW